MVVLAALVEPAVEGLDSLWQTGKVMALEALVIVLALGTAVELLAFSSLGTEALVKLEFDEFLGMAVSLKLEFDEFLGMAASVKLEVDEFLGILVARLLSGEGTLAVLLQPFSPLFC